MNEWRQYILDIYLVFRIINLYINEVSLQYYKVGNSIIFIQFIWHTFNVVQRALSH